MIALDTNLLIYAHRAGVPEHRRAQRAIERACDDPRGCGVSAPCVAEMWAIVTHPAAVGGPSRGHRVLSFVERLVEDGGLHIWLPGPGFAERLMQEAARLGIRGVRVFDLQIGLLAREAGAREIWTHDAGFVKIPGLAVHDPLAST